MDSIDGENYELIMALLEDEEMMEMACDEEIGDTGVEVSRPLGDITP